MHLFYRAATAAICLLSAAALARAPVPLTLAEAEDRALDTEPGHLSLRLSADALRDRSAAAADLPDPVLRLGLNNYPIESGGFSTEGMTHAAIGISQMFPRGKSRHLNSEKLERLADAADESAAARERDVLALSRRAWLDAYFWQASGALLRESRPFFRDLAEISRSLYEVGRKSQQDVLRAELELSRLDDRLIDNERQLARARAVLGEWVGEASVRPVADKLPAWDRIPTLDDLRRELSVHPRLRAADAEVSARDTGVELAKQRARPDWAVSLGYSYREGNLPGGEPRSDFVSLGVTVDLPFFSRRSVDGTLAAALKEESAAKARREQLSRQLVRELEAEYVHWIELSRRLELFETRILAQASNHAEAALLAYQNDRADFADVMRGFIDNLDTRTQYLELQVQQARSYTVLADLGGLPR